MRVGSIRRRLLGLLLLSLTVAWTAVAAVTYVYAHHEVDALLDAHLEQASRMLVAQAGHELDEIEWDQDAEGGDEGYRSVVAFQVRTQQGRVLLRSANAPVIAFSSKTAGFDETQRGGVRWRVYSATADEGDTVIHVAEHHAARDRIARRMALTALIPLLVIGPLLALLIWWVVGRAMLPLDQLGDQIADRSVDDLAPVAAGGLPEELRPLVHRLDQLFARLRDSIDSERGFTSHAAHELRTPMAGLRAQAEVALSARDAAVREAALHHCIEACDRMSRLVSQLLLLARADELRVLPSADACSLEPIAQSVIADLAPHAAGSGCTLSLDTICAGTVRGDPALLAAMLRNLVENAVRYGAKHVRVLVETQGQDVLLRVEDDGPGVPEEALSQLGQRFFRGTDRGGGGSGLGLSIVARIAKLHDASLHLENRKPGPGFAAAVRFRKKATR